MLPVIARVVLITGLLSTRSVPLQARLVLMSIVHADPVALHYL